MMADEAGPIILSAFLLRMIIHWHFNGEERTLIHLVSENWARGMKTKHKATSKQDQAGQKKCANCTLKSRKGGRVARTQKREEEAV